MYFDDATVERYVMKLAFTCVFALLATNTHAVTVSLKDGTKLEATKVSEAGSNLEVQTKYGNLLTSKSEVENLAELGFSLNSIEHGPYTTGLEFVSSIMQDSSIKIDYYSNKEKTGSQIYSQVGDLLNQEGRVADGTHREYYPDGKRKKEKTIIDGLNNGAFKTYYPDGVLQSEGYFINGKMTGGYRIYFDSGKIMLERNYIDGILNGYSREYNESGSVISQTLYVKGEPKVQNDLAGVQYQEINGGIRKDKEIGVAKANLIIASAEVFSVGGANKEWEANLNAAVSLLGGLYDYANGEVTTYPGVGVGLGIALGNYKDSPVYIAANYVKGPSADIDVNVTDSVYGSGTYNEEIETTYFRVMAGCKFMLPISETVNFMLDVNGGIGGGSIDSERTLYLSGGTRSSGSSSESWTGFTWAVGPKLSWEMPKYIFELGVQYNAFPDLKNNDKFSDVIWRPISVSASFLF